MAENDGITRRDFLDGAAISLASACLAPEAFAAKSELREETTTAEKYYPPELTGMRGSHPGSFDVAHRLAWSGDAPTDFHQTNEEYDLVVVGGGLSGLAAALFFQQERGADQRILILDNHDDFGGHAKRNEFNVQGQMLLGVGGSINLEFPEKYSAEVKRLLKGIGIDTKRLKAANNPDHPLVGGFRNTGFFVKATNGERSAVTGRWMAALHGKADPKPLVEQLPYAREDKDKILKLLSGKWDYLVGLSIAERAAYLSSHSYHSFLTEKVGLSTSVLPFFDSLLRSLNGVGGDGLSVSEALMGGAPGLRAVGWPWAWAERLLVNEDSYQALIFPDGNASVARLMVRKLIPDVADGESFEDIANARFDYSKLDVESSKVRLRLNSTVVRVEQDGRDVHVSYVESGVASRVKAKHCILACYNAIIPHLCPELSNEQKEALKYGSKIPFIWVNVAIRKGAPFFKAGSDIFFCPNSYFHVVNRAPSVSLPDYQTPEKDTDPLVVFMFHSPTPLKQEGQSNRDLFRIARHKLLQTPFSTFEAEIKSQLTEMYGDHGFVADRDIEAITVNRWSHGYAYSYCELDDPEFEAGKYPHEIGRKQFGRISIANSDAEAKPYLDAAIDAAWRAVRQQTLINNYD